VRIGFDAKRLFNNFTGLGNYSRFIVNALVSHFPEHDYWLYTPKLKGHPETLHFLDSNRFTVRQPEPGLGSMFPGWWRSFQLGSVAYRDGVNIFHGLSNELPSGKPSRLKTVVTVHDLIFKRFPQYYNPVDIQIYSWKLARACTSADAIVAVSHQTAADLRELMSVKEDKIRVVYQGCHPNFKREVTSEVLDQVRQKYNLPERFILCVGTLEERKNAALLLKALPMVKEKIPIVLVGKSTSYKNKLEELVIRNRQTDRVQFLHHVSFADLPAVYRLAQLFVYPSVFEGFGIPIVEAIVSGVPVITSRGSCFDEAGGPATRYVNPANPEELATQINQVLSNSSMQREMIDRSKEYVSRFEPAIIARQLMQVYQEMD
jgi:glycosyltransferase involved in cell wall biosynthesis